MMLKCKSNPWRKLKFAGLLPLAAVAVTTFARPEVSNELEKLSNAKITEIIPELKVLQAEPLTVTDTIPRVSNILEKKKMPKEAVYIIDGKKANKTVVDKLDPLNIQRVDVLKDATPDLLERYGSDAKHGVVLITTLKNEWEKVSQENQGKLSEEQKKALKDQEKTFKELEKAFKDKEGKFSEEQKRALKEQEKVFVEKEKMLKDQEKAFKEMEKTFKEQEKTFKEQEKLLSENQKAFEKMLNAPLTIVDGKVVEDMSSIAPETIESVSVLKKEDLLKSYIEEYGPKAKNGVVVIELKK